eukprot:CAMPEP_0179001124 /NCGR_PEP_ID=MMETSP0795-20121207/11139_1 /TAXON_ID=88552 /ORGANISM="Amoebophrya sp., Strain Ameob2" /LENGTH=78 /DNA_ID=CAMNT_0020694369 /DNA_START=90 /DNA_END=322 /DNA_ORIENTATION=-
MVSERDANLVMQINGDVNCFFVQGNDGHGYVDAGKTKCDAVQYRNNKIQCGGDPLRRAPKVPRGYPRQATVFFRALPA